MTWVELAWGWWLGLRWMSLDPSRRTARRASCISGSSRTGGDRKTERAPKAEHKHLPRVVVVVVVVVLVVVVEVAAAAAAAWRL